MLLLEAGADRESWVCPEVIDGALNAARSLFELAREEK